MGGTLGHNLLRLCLVILGNMSDVNKKFKKVLFSRSFPTKPSTLNPKS